MPPPVSEPSHCAIGLYTESLCRASSVQRDLIHWYHNAIKWLKKGVRVGSLLDTDWLPFRNLSTNHFLSGPPKFPKDCGLRDEATKAMLELIERTIVCSESCSFQRRPFQWNAVTLQVDRLQW